MNCADYKKSLYDFVEGQLDEGASADVEGHASACPPCGDLLQRWREMTCRQLVGFLQDFLDGELEAEQARVFRRHLEFCPPCVDYLDGYEKTVALGKEVCRADGKMPEQVPEQLIRAVLDAQRRTRPSD